MRLDPIKDQGHARRSRKSGADGSRRPIEAEVDEEMDSVAEAGSRRERRPSQWPELVCRCDATLCAGLVQVGSMVLMNVFVDRSRGHLGQRRRRIAHPVTARAACRHADRGPSFEGEQQRAGQHESPDEL